MENDTLRMTRSFLKRMFKNVKAALSKKANTEDVIPIDDIGVTVAPLDDTRRVPKNYINEDNLGILEVEKTVSGVTGEPSSITVYDYIVWDTESKRFYAFVSANSSKISLEPLLPSTGNTDKYYMNWRDRLNYEEDDFNARQDRIFVFKEQNKFYRWNGSELQEVCMPLGTTSGTAFSGEEGNTLKTTVNDHERKIIRAALTGLPITKTNSFNLKSTMFQYDLFERSGSLYILLNNVFTKIGLSSLVDWADYFKMPTPISTSDIRMTPFKDVEGMITGIYKGEVVGDYRKWYLVMKEDSEDQTYTAGTSTNINYYNQKYTCYYGEINKPWELWLPLTVTRQSVYIDY